ncbi:hypothetical protein [Wenyingzhuangia sp. IMCC45467]
MFNVKKQISETNIKSLAAAMDFNCVSFYCALNNKIKDSKNTFIKLLEKLKKKLTSNHITGDSFYNIIKPLEQVYNDQDFWNDKDLINNGNTLVIFMDENNIDAYVLNKKIQSSIHLTSNYYLLPLFKSVTNQQIQQGSLRIEESLYNDDKTTNRLEKIIPLAYDGKVDTLYVSSENGVYGVYDDVNKTTMIDSEKSTKNMSLINLAAIVTFINRGKVFLIDPMLMPSKGVSIQAILK